MNEIFIGLIVAVLSGVILNAIGAISFKNIIYKLKNKTSRPYSGANIFFISAGGTCRDPMAAAITKYLFNQNKELNIAPNIYARALGPVSKSETSYAARMAIKKILGEDLLVGHEPKQISNEDIKKADILLVMEKSLLLRKTLPNEKTYILKDFFGKEGDIIDPWPDGKDDITLRRYIETANELKAVIEPGFNQLVNAIQK